MLSSPWRCLSVTVPPVLDEIKTPELQIRQSPEVCLQPERSREQNVNYSKPSKKEKRLVQRSNSTRVNGTDGRPSYRQTHLPLSAVTRLPTLPVSPQSQQQRYHKIPARTCAGGAYLSGGERLPRGQVRVQPRASSQQHRRETFPILPGHSQPFPVISERLHPPAVHGGA
ncbi:hypothetical protein FQA47_007248 [Oryzias melastigma]|uniref:Uncharacterized protein n=1 Tax=Oryzias melastigma TaxID=30732 RepID=A0A834BPV4_ORYME|nr:hypothetical protein FQA47_007248 [Oryzias melastigma]